MNQRLALSIWSIAWTFQFSYAIQYFLDGNDWIFYSQQVNYTGKATVPGGIYTDLWRNGIIKEDPLYNDNDSKYRWVGRVNWTYSRQFSVPFGMLESRGIFLVCHGIDTISTIYINGKFVGKTENMFTRYKFDVKSLLNSRDNRIVVAFESPIKWAKERHDKQAKSYAIPPLCPREVQNGECHVNYLRKMQSSFSWDWGPAYPSMGIWKSITLEAYDYAIIRDMMVDTILMRNNHWAINTTLIVETATNETFPAVVEIYFEKMKLLEKRVEITLCPLATTGLNFFLPLNFTRNIQLWWPNQVGILGENGFEARQRKLYNLKAIIRHPSKSQTTHGKTVRIGFRTVELVQDPGPNSLTFYFRINGRPIFMKGSNWIPGHVLPERSKEALELLDAAAAANMNMLRVWGGGIYELDEFYDKADELGILIWQDFMFAVALYPANDEFLSSVKLEVYQQIARLQHHPCIAIWAGNNENELAIASSWWSEIHFNRQKFEEDYKKLYINVIRNEVLSKNFSMIYVSSSPSNGIETEKEGWISKNPGSNNYGDVHYYNYFSDGWQWTQYPSCKFASEYGFQSYPSVKTLLKYLPMNDLGYPLSESLARRQHAPGGDDRILSEIKEHFGDNILKKATTSTEKLKQLIYLSQVEQAMSIKTETEFYRRNRKLDPSGTGLTMGALYWQLNDVWAAPTWSSIEYGGKWKVLHYFAVNFFSPIHVVPYIADNDNLQMDLVNDAFNDLELRIRLTMYTWDRFEPLAFRVQVSKCAANAVCLIFSSNWRSLMQQGHCKSLQHCFLWVEYENMEATFISENFLLLSKPKDIIGLKPSGLKVTHITEMVVSRHRYLYNITLEANAISLFVWLDFSANSTISGEFSENGFIQTAPIKVLTFTSSKRYAPEYLMNNIYVTCFNDI